MSTGLTAALEYHVVNSLGWADLRPLQRAAVEPVSAGADALLLAPTAGGKTEAAVFPLLSAMVEQEWRGLSVLYVTPLKALLNNLEPRLAGYTSWLGRRVDLWHGDVTTGQRRRIIADPPDILLTTPESLEAMLVSATIEHRPLFAHLRAVVVDELHAFAGDDRGWHLLSVLERLQHVAGRRLQRVGLSATVGNPGELLEWLAGARPPERSEVIAPDAPGMASAQPRHLPAAADVTLDYVGSISNAATVIAALHAGEKRLVFCDSRAQTESLARELRERDITTFVSHSSLSADERRRSEQAFAEARDCVVVATSTLELGIDVGDLDRVIQIDAPRTVASFLQRLGRTGRRPGTTRNMLFLATGDDALLQAAALLRLWAKGFVEPVAPPPAPWHISAQQLLALALQQGSFGRRTWRSWWSGLAVMERGEQILEYLLAEGFLDSDQDLLFIGPEAERHFGRRNFMELTAVFTAEPELKVLHGRAEIGTVAPGTLLLQQPEGQPRVLSLGGRGWRVTHTDWRRRTVHVTPADDRGRSRWGRGTAGTGAQLAQSMRAVLLGEEPGGSLSRRAAAALPRIRDERRVTVSPTGPVLTVDGDSSRWWTYAGTRANTSLAAALAASGLDVTSDGLCVTVKSRLNSADLRSAAEAGWGSQPQPDPNALQGLKFNTALPAVLAAEEIAARTTDAKRAAEILAAWNANPGD